jgi:hypothetical protein
MDNTVLTGKSDFGNGFNFGIQQSEGINNYFFDPTNSKILDPTSPLDPAMDDFDIINQISDIDNLITILEKGKENTIENIIVAADKLYKGMSELNETIIFDDDFCDISYNYLMDALREFTTNWKWLE